MLASVCLVDVCMLAYTSHRCVHMYTGSCTRKPTYLYACAADVYLIYIYAHIHTSV